MTIRRDEHPDDALLERFLTGSLPEEDAELLEERSLTDDDFAARLAAVEDDLADAYVRGELEPAARARFEAAYLGSDRGRAKVAAAGALLARERRDATGAPVPFRSRTASRWIALAAAAALVIAAAWALSEARRRDGSEVAEMPAPKTHPQPSREIAERMPVPPAPGTEKPVPKPSPGGPASTPLVVSLVLLPQTRTQSDLAAVTLPRGADFVAARLELEFDEMAHYAVALKDADDRIVWRADRLTSTRHGDGRSLRIRLPADLLRSGSHTFEVSGIADDGTSEFVGSYAFRAVLE